MTVSLVAPAVAPSAPIHSPQAAYDLLAPCYDATFVSPLALAENAVARRLLLVSGAAEGRVLDLGCGTGLLLELLPIPPDRYVGIDISAGMLHVARRKFPDHTFIGCDMAALPFVTPFDRWADAANGSRPCAKDLLGGMSAAAYRAASYGSHRTTYMAQIQQFDSAVCLFGSMSYVLHPARVASALYELLRPGGQFFLMLLGHRYADRKSHIVEAHGMTVPFMTWTPQALRNLFAGFRDVGVRGLHATTEHVLPDRIPTLLARAYLSVEAATLGRLRPSACFYQIVTGTRP